MMVHRRTHTDQTGLIVAVAGIAAAVGALVAVFTTPKKGSEVRGDVKQLVKNNKDRLMQTKHGIDEARDEADKQTVELIKTLDADEDSGDTPPPHVPVTSNDVMPEADGKNGKRGKK